jgi:hypothetical protein
MSGCTHTSSADSSNNQLASSGQYKSIQESTATVQESYAWYNYMPIVEDSSTPLYVTTDIALFNNTSHSKTFTVDATITHDTRSYPVTLSLSNTNTDIPWNGVIAPSEKQYLTARIENGPQNISEDEQITLEFILTDTENNTLTITTVTTVIFTW